jgi:hypothetical protein
MCRPSRLIGMPDFAHRSATDTGWPRNFAISDHPFRDSDPALGLAIFGRKHGMLAGHCYGSIQNVFVQPVGHLLCLIQRKTTQKIKAESSMVQHRHGSMEELKGDYWPATLIFVRDKATRSALDSYIRHVNL